MKIVVVVPTYNEKENIKKLIPLLSNVFAESKLDFSLLIVDGNSPDGTFELATEFSEDYKFVYPLLEKKKAGLGAAYVYGFDYAINKLKADIIVEMDADFQHDPKDLPRLVKPILENKADYVIGSRFTKGGSIPKEWAFNRKLLSIGGNIFSKFVLGIFNVNDFTSGFKASRVEGFVTKLPLDKILSAGFAYKIDLLFKMHRLGARIQEVPIAFGVRDRGNSKMESNNAIDTLRVVVMLRVNENKSFFKFIIVGFTGLFVDAGLFNIFRLVPSILPSVGAIISGLLAMFTTFLLNNAWSFGERQLKITLGKAVGVLLYVSSLLMLLSRSTTVSQSVLIVTPFTVLAIVILDRITKYKLVHLPKFIIGLLNVFIYFVFSFFPIVIRSNIVHLSVLRFGDTFIFTNIAFFIGIAFGLIWNFTVYSKIIWKKQK